MCGFILCALRVFGFGLICVAFAVWRLGVRHSLGYFRDSCMLLLGSRASQLRDETRVAVGSRISISRPPQPSVQSLRDEADRAKCASQLSHSPAPFRLRRNSRPPYSHASPLITATTTVHSVDENQVGAKNLW